MEVIKSPTAVVPGLNKNEILNQTKSLLSNINTATKDSIGTLETLIKKVNNNEINISKGISILDVKYQSKLMYLANVSYLIMKKLHSELINKDEAIERLVELRTIIEKIKPLEQKLKYQIDKYIKIAIKGETDPNDPSNFKANPMNLMEDDNDSDEDTKKKGKKNDKKESTASNIYKPPKLASVHYNGDETKNDKMTRSLERSRKRALQSSIMQELKEEYLDKPIEYSHMSSISLKNVQSEKEKEQQHYEETYFTRLPMQKKSNKRLMTLNSIGDQVTHFEDISVLHDGGDDDGEERMLNKGKKRKRNDGGKGGGKKKGNKKGGGGGKKKRKFK